ncbi:MAG: hypothetical protein JXA94_05805 [Parachlamydiales bacterium]|nr:hypothetical protein [Parachlamydiales bacterium]
MSQLPSSFSSNPNQDPHKYFKNLLKSLKKDIDSAASIDELKEQMMTFLNASKEVSQVDHHKKGVYHKPEVEKALNKVAKEFDKYYLIYSKNPENANTQDLLEAILLVENLVTENDIY